MKPSLPKGTRDFAPLEVIQRRYIFDQIRRIFELYGFQPLETPAMENLDTLTGKYGDEGDRLIFKILNSGEYLKDIRISLNAEKPPVKPESNTVLLSELLHEKMLSPLICEKALRYDLTIPFARFVAMNRDKLAFPFKRYQIQPVWRADRPQKGRYREFWQCDADVVGTSSMINEAEFIRIYDDVFAALRIPVNILLNNRKILSGIAEVIGEPDRLTDITVALDKLDKIGRDKVEEEMLAKGVSHQAIELLSPLFSIKGTNNEQLDFLDTYLSTSETGKLGIAEIRQVLAYFEANQAKPLKQAKLQLDLTLARGLNYYTGTILEVKARDIPFGSIGGGGRYDNLTGIFGLPGVPGVGISFGADRIYDIMEQLKCFPEELLGTTRLLMINFGGNDELAALSLVHDLRAQGISCELYPEAVKIRKQFEFAEKKGIPYVGLFGEDVRNREKPMIELKHLQSGEQTINPIQDLHTLLL